MTDGRGRGAPSGQGHIVDKMNEFAPGIVEGQAMFFRVPEEGPVERHWVVPGRWTSSTHGVAAEHPLGEDAAPGWYDAEGRRLPRDPREGEGA